MGGENSTGDAGKVKHFNLIVHILNLISNIKLSDNF